jgi:hypothetical protein
VAWGPIYRAAREWLALGVYLANRLTRSTPIPRNGINSLPTAVAWALRRHYDGVMEEDFTSVIEDVLQRLYRTQSHEHSHTAPSADKSA